MAKLMPLLVQSSPDAERPCAPIVAEAEEPTGMVTCATTAAPAGPLFGTIQNTAPSFVCRPESAVHDPHSMPIDESAPFGNLIY